ncbi:MAG: metallophosphoesterase family protein [Bacteroidales bacterium]|nr:metallophosphoesterase family protein [Bacteroidales bacterium]
MKRILLISDTHNYIDATMIAHAERADEIWHAGDIGSLALLEKLQEIKPVRAVWGNIDGQDVRIRVPKIAQFECEGLKVMMTHIGGYPGRYDPTVRMEILKERPQLFVSGHSHILKVMNDKKLGLLHMNPGAIGKTGFHQVRTMIEFEIDNGVPKNLAVVECNRW